MYGSSLGILLYLPVPWFLSTIFRALHPVLRFRSSVNYLPDPADFNFNGLELILAQNPFIKETLSILFHEFKVLHRVTPESPVIAEHASYVLAFEVYLGLYQGVIDKPVRFTGVSCWRRILEGAARSQRTYLS